MRLVSYKREGAAPRAGMLVDGDVVDLEESGRAIGVELGADLLAILRQEQAGVDALRAVAAESHRLPRVPLGEVQLGPALSSIRRRFFCWPPTTSRTSPRAVRRRSTRRRSRRASS